MRWEGQHQGTVLLINLLIIVFRTTYMMVHQENYPRNPWQIGLVRLVTAFIILCGYIRIYSEENPIVRDVSICFLFRLARLVVEGRGKNVILFLTLAST